MAKTALLRLSFTAALIAVLSGCGNNPLQRKSNPVEAKEYPNLTKAVQEKRLKPYDGKPVIDPKDPDNSQFVCFEPFEVRVNPDHGYKLLSFVEGTETSYTIEVRSRIDNDFKVAATKPKNSSFELVQRSANLATYQFKWSPKKNRHNGETIENLRLDFQSDAVFRNCDGAEITETINLLVAKVESAIEKRAVNQGKQGQDSCYEPFKISIEKDFGNRMMAFTEDIQGGYNLTIRSLLDDNFEVTPVLPQSATWRVISRKGNVGKYRFNYQPMKAGYGEEHVRFLVLNFTSDQVVGRCGPEASQSLINLFVRKSSIAPKIAFKGFAGAPVQYPTVSAFTLEITDLASNDQSGPIIEAITFPASASTGERKVLNAANAVTCGRPRQAEGNVWTADCQFDPTKVKGVSALVNSGQIADVTFAITALSQRSQIASAVTSSPRLRVEFLKPEPIATETPSADLKAADPTADIKKPVVAKTAAKPAASKSSSKGAKK